MGVPLLEHPEPLLGAELRAQSPKRVRFGVFAPTLGSPRFGGGDTVAPPSDIQFWNSRQSLEGLSVRSVFFGVFQSLVVLLYILDNETNFVVQVSVFIGLLIDLWKITKVMDVRVRGSQGGATSLQELWHTVIHSFFVPPPFYFLQLDREHKVGGLLPRPTFTDKSTYIESSTKVYDDVSGSGGCPDPPGGV